MSAITIVVANSIRLPRALTTGAGVPRAAQIFTEIVPVATSRERLFAITKSSRVKTKSIAEAARIARTSRGSRTLRTAWKQDQTEHHRKRGFPHGLPTRSRSRHRTRAIDPVREATARSSRHVPRGGPGGAEGILDPFIEDPIRHYL